MKNGVRFRATFSSTEAKQLWDEVKENIARLEACPRHQFEGRLKPAPGEKVLCIRCNGQMSHLDANQYLRGYQAAGGDPVDIWPGWEKQNAVS